MDTPEELKYTKAHEWVRLEGDVARVGITDFAQESLGDIVYVELPETDEQVEKEAEVGTVESVKAASPIYSPVSGTIVENNSDLEATPELINQKPYETFIFTVKMNDPTEVDSLMDAAAYKIIVEQEKENQ